MANLRIHRFLPLTKAEGPGTRACVWVQGCSIRCEGCAVPWTWDRKGGISVDTDDLAEAILGTGGIEGVTFVGGEPFEQASALASLGSAVRHAGLSVVTFTGLTYEGIIEAARPDWNDLLAVTDLLLDGPYQKDTAETTRPWVGSGNQRFHFLTDRYVHLAGSLTQIANRIEVHVLTNGTVVINGMAPPGVLDELLRGRI